MSRRKFTSGVLATDADGVVAFFWGKAAPPQWVELSQMWLSSLTRCKEWTARQWRAAYSLKPPKPGKCFECKVEL